MAAASDFVIVTTTIDTEDMAYSFAESIIDNRLAACVQVNAIWSVYNWQGERKSHGEFRLEAKTRADLAPALMHHVKTYHPYSLPELAIVPLLGGSEEYLNWIAAETAPISN